MPLSMKDFEDAQPPSTMPETGQTNQMLPSTMTPAQRFKAMGPAATPPAQVGPPQEPMGPPEETAAQVAGRTAKTVANAGQQVMASGPQLAFQELPIAANIGASVAASGRIINTVAALPINPILKSAIIAGATIFTGATAETLGRGAQLALDGELDLTDQAKRDAFLAEAGGIYGTNIRWGGGAAALFGGTSATWRAIRRGTLGPARTESIAIAERVGERMGKARIPNSDLRGTSYMGDRVTADTAAMLGTANIPIGAEHIAQSNWKGVYSNMLRGAFTTKRFREQTANRFRAIGVYAQSIAQDVVYSAKNPSATFARFLDNLGTANPKDAQHMFAQLLGGDDTHFGALGAAVLDEASTRGGHFIVSTKGLSRDIREAIHEYAAAPGTPGAMPSGAAALIDIGNLDRHVRAYATEVVERRLLTDPGLAQDIADGITTKAKLITEEAMNWATVDNLTQAGTTWGAQTAKRGGYDAWGRPRDGHRAATITEQIKSIRQRALKEGYGYAPPLGPRPKPPAPVAGPASSPPGAAGPPTPAPKPGGRKGKAAAAPAVAPAPAPAAPPAPAGTAPAAPTGGLPNMPPRGRGAPGGQLWQPREGGGFTSPDGSWSVQLREGKWAIVNNLNDAPTAFYPTPKAALRAAARNTRKDAEVGAAKNPRQPDLTATILDPNYEAAAQAERKLREAEAASTAQAAKPKATAAAAPNPPAAAAHTTMATESLPEIPPEALASVARHAKRFEDAQLAHRQAQDALDAAMVHGEASPQVAEAKKAVAKALALKNTEAAALSLLGKSEAMQAHVGAAKARTEAATAAAYQALREKGGLPLQGAVTGNKRPKGKAKATASRPATAAEAEVYSLGEGGFEPASANATMARVMDDMAARKAAVAAASPPGSAKIRRAAAKAQTDAWAKEAEQTKAPPASEFSIADDAVEAADPTTIRAAVRKNFDEVHNVVVHDIGSADKVTGKHLDQAMEYVDLLEEHGVDPGDLRDTLDELINLRGSTASELDMTGAERKEAIEEATSALQEAINNFDSGTALDDLPDDALEALNEALGVAAPRPTPPTSRRRK